MERIWEVISAYISVPYLVSFLVASYAVKQYLGAWLNKATKKEWKTVYTVLIIALLLAGVFYLLDEAPIKLAFSYFLGTSLHETAFWFIENKIKGKQ